jgi:hypothetical protein
MELAEATPGAVAFLDFGDRDFDQVAVIEPSRRQGYFGKSNLPLR